MEQMFRVGVVSSTHGIRGELKIFPTTDDRERFRWLKEAVLSGREGQIPVEVAGVKYVRQFAVLKFRGIDTIEEAERYKGYDLMVTRENAIPLEEDEYYVADLLGLTVITDRGETLGVLEDILQTGANDVYAVRTPEGREVLLPAIRECVLEISPEKGTVTVRLLPGLID